MYVREGLVVVREEEDKEFSQYCKMRMDCGGEQLHIYLIYRSPSAALETMQGLIELMSGVEKNSFMLGDFNIPEIDWEKGTAEGRRPKEFLQAAEDNFLTQMVKFPTHIKGNVLDLILTNAEEKVESVTEAGRLGKSDHVILSMVVSVEAGWRREREEMILDWNKADWKEMKKQVGEKDWKEEMKNKDVNSAWEGLRDTLNRAVEENVPKKKRRKQNRPAWLSQEILRGIRKKKRLWKRAKLGENLEQYKEEEKRVKRMIRNARRKLERKLAEEKDNKRPFYSYVRKKTKSRQGVGPLRREDGGIVEDEKEMAEILNKYFSSVYSEKNSFREEPVQEEQVEHEMREVKITEKKIKEKIEKLKYNSAPGPDQIQPSLLQNLKEEITLPLKIIFEKSIQQGKIPEDWRKANITPIFKKGSKKDAGNYRPVALTSVCCKIMEHLIRDEVVLHLDKNKLIKDSQHGFRSKMSCTTNLLEFFETATEVLDTGAPMDLVFLDLAKAFDKVPHNLLVQKMKSKKICEKVVTWVEDWLKDRKQRVVLNGQESEWQEVKSGIIQGSVLGPTAFDIYMDDVDVVLALLTIFKKFADDTKLGQEMRTDRDREVLQQALNMLEAWAQRWGMEFNVAKCKVMHLGQRNPHHQYTMPGRVLTETKEEKDIGVVVAENMRPKQQCAKASQVARAVLGQITRAFHYRDRHTFKKLYVQYVRPHLEFAAPAWSPWTQEDKDTLEPVQISAVSQMSGLRGRTYEEKLKEIGLDTLERRREDMDLIQTFKIISGEDNVKKGTWFRMSSENSQRTTRATADATRIDTKRVRTEARGHFFSCRVTGPWNELPQEVRTAKSTKEFKKKLKKHRANAALAF